MSAGEIVGALWMLAFWVFVVSVFVFPIVHAYWRARERADQKATDEQLERCKADTTHQHEQDAL